MIALTIALEIFDNLANYSEDFNVAYHELDNGAKIVDCGVSVLAGMLPGNYRTWEAAVK